MPGLGQTGNARGSSYRWVICALLFFAATVNYIDRQVLAFIKELLDQELGWTNEQFGMVNSAFQLAYAGGLLIFGWFVDRYGTKIGYGVSIVLWSLAAISHSLVGSVRGFFEARVGPGISEGGNFPSAIWLLPERCLPYSFRNQFLGGHFAHFSSEFDLIA